MRAAGERRGVEPRLGEHRRRRLDMRRRAGMRRAGERDFGLAEPQRVGRAALDQRQRLQRLDGGARKNRFVDFAEHERDRAVGVDDRAGAAVARFDARAAHDLDDDGIGQSERSCRR